MLENFLFHSPKYLRFRVYSCLQSINDFTGVYLQPFNEILELVPLAESVIKLSAVCMSCRGEAAFSRRLGNEKEVEVIGHEDKYMSVCRACFQKPDIQEQFIFLFSKQNHCSEMYLIVLASNFLLSSKRNGCHGMPLYRVKSTYNMVYIKHSLSDTILDVSNLCH